MPIQTTAVTRLGISGGIWNRLGGDYSNKAASPPVFAGTIPNISATEGDSDVITDLSTYFSGATSYSISPAVEAGWNFDTVTGILTVDTDDVNTFGPYTVTGTNAAGSDASNAFSVVISNTVAAGGTSNRLKKRENLEDLRRASQLALLRRRKAEELEAKVEAQLEKAVPAGATIEYDPQAMRIAKITDKIDQALAIAFEAQRQADEEQEQTRKRRKRDQIAVMLLLH